MNKRELVDNVAAITKYRPDACEVVIDALFDEIKNALIKGEKIKLKGLMTFEPYTSPARNIRNPTTGNLSVLPAQKKVRLRLGQTIKNGMNYENEKD